MPRIAILGGGIAALAAAYELEQQRQAGKPLDWHLYEASPRLGGTVATTRFTTPDGEYILEDGPDAWVTEKPWARELAEELGLGDQVIACNEADKKTYIWLDGELVAMPDRMRLMVPEDLRTLDTSPLFSEAAKLAYREELARAKELRAAAPGSDESVASFVRRHFGDEVLEKIGAPLLSGVFGGDVQKLSVQAVMPAFVAMEDEHGSLIAALQRKARERGNRPPQPTFTTLRRGMGSLVEALVAALPADRLHTGNRAAALTRSPKGEWLVRFTGEGSASCAIGFVPFDDVFLAVPAHEAAALLAPGDPASAALLPTESSSAVLATFCWPPAQAAAFDLPPGFGFLVPQAAQAVLSTDIRQSRGGGTRSLAPPQDPTTTTPKLLAGTLTTQKFPHRAPAGAKVIRVFYSGPLAEALQHQPDTTVAAEALTELRRVLPTLPDPESTLITVSRWPRSLPQYAVEHLDRIDELEERVATLGHLHLLGNAYHGVGVPDLIRDARAAAKNISST